MTTLRNCSTRKNLYELPHKYFPRVSTRTSSTTKSYKRFWKGGLCITNFRLKSAPTLGSRRSSEVSHNNSSLSHRKRKLFNLMRVSRLAEPGTAGRKQRL